MNRTMVVVSCLVLLTAAAVTLAQSRRSFPVETSKHADENAVFARNGALPYQEAVVNKEASTEEKKKIEEEQDKDKGQINLKF